MKYLERAGRLGGPHRGLRQHIKQGSEQTNLRCGDARCDVLWTGDRVVLCWLLCCNDDIVLLTEEVFVFRPWEQPGLKVTPPLQVRTVLHNGFETQAIYLTCPIMFSGSGFHESALLAKPREGFHEGDLPAKFFIGFHALLAKPYSGFHEGDPLVKPRRVFHESTLLAKFRSGFYDSLLGIPRKRFYKSHLFASINMDRFDGGMLDPVPKFYGLWILSAESRSGFYQSVSDPMVLLAEPCYGSYLLAIPREGFYAKRSNQGESSGSGGRAGEERNGGGGDGNQGIGGGVGGGGHREGIGNERRGSGGRSHGGDNGEDDNNDRRGGVGDIEDERRPMDPITDRMAEILLSLNVQVIAALESLDVTMLSARSRILRVVSLGFNSGALVCLSASIRQRRTNPRLAIILSWIGSVATFLGFISMITMALLASGYP